MSIKHKRSGPVPIFPERWQELAKDPNRLVEAAREYRSVYKNASLVEAARMVRQFHQKFTSTYKGKQ